MEINSSFHRPHARAVYLRWAASTPPAFRFSVKLPRTITHELRLRRARRPLAGFLDQVGGLGVKLGALLVQLPPSLDYDARAAGRFFEMLRHGHAGAVVCEPRHTSWFTAAAERALQSHRIGRVAADPACVPAARYPGGWLTPAAATPAVTYHRLHGSPRMYWSRYSDADLQAWADAIAARDGAEDVWCIFDNTAMGAAIENALEMSRIAGRAARRSSGLFGDGDGAFPRRGRPSLRAQRNRRIHAGRSPGGPR